MSLRPRTSAMPVQLGSAVSSVPSTMAMAKPNSISWPCHSGGVRPARARSTRPIQAAMAPAASSGAYTAPSR